MNRWGDEESAIPQGSCAVQLAPSRGWPVPLQLSASWTCAAVVTALWSGLLEAVFLLEARAGGLSGSAELQRSCSWTGQGTSVHQGRKQQQRERSLLTDAAGRKEKEVPRGGGLGWEWAPSWQKECVCCQCAELKVVFLWIFVYVAQPQSQCQPLPPEWLGCRQDRFMRVGESERRVMEGADQRVRRQAQG